jgi:ribosome-binding factor A
MDEHRTLRVSEAVREELSEVIGFETDDPRLLAVEVTDVHVSPDGRYATIRPRAGLFPVRTGGPPQPPACP